MPASLNQLEKTLSVLWTNQSARASFLKDGQLPNALDESIDARGVRTYAELIHIGRSDLMLSIYPGCARLLNKKWQSTINHYFETYPPDHFRLNMAARGFSQYLKEFGQDHLKKFPYLSDLADYEWVELQLMEDARQIEPKPHKPLSEPEQFEKQAPIVNPVLAIREYDYPVPLIVDYLRDGELPRNISPREVIIAVYRDPETHLGRYVELQAGIHQLVKTAQESKTSYADLASLAIAQGAGDSVEARLIEFIEAIEKLQSLNLFIGSQTV